MAKFTFHMGVDIRAYGNVEVAALTVDDAVKALTPDFVAENIERGEVTWDSVSNLSIIDASESDTEALIEEWCGVDLLPPPTEPDLRLIASINDMLPSGTVWCFVANPHPHPKGDGFILGVATLGEAGWTPLPGPLAFADMGAAYDRADALNRLLPYSAAACSAIIADTMHRSRMKLEREDGKSRFKVTVTYSERIPQGAERNEYETRVAEEMENVLTDTLFASDGLNYPGDDLPEFTVEVD